MSVITMELRDGREKRNERAINRRDYCTQAELSGHGRVRQGSTDGVCSPVCKSEEGKHNSSFARKWNSSVQNIESIKQNRIISWNGNFNHSCSNYKKYTNSVTFLIDKYTKPVYINPHNTPTKNKKARRQPGSELDKSPTTDLCLSPLLFAVNQKI
ncbi:hypothetical protein LEP1GSC158_0647 [Leptospira interrogans serovar Zanoni str. LT2156]|uniref:Uncharacterized protein n=1 Tax=Leptospira interrogans serovar Zanoni str. LT2156 TaxID=1001601 RepID=M6HH76_LEPIR|nr:hypothetical protein LEP1GSC158_0647 [Leptospira interrogans serovar Zanoni str. LT2156]